MSDQNSQRFSSTYSFKSQQSVESAQGEVFLADENVPQRGEENGGGDLLVQEEDFQSEVDCAGSECAFKRNSANSVTNVSRQSSQQHEPTRGTEVEEAEVESIQQEAGEGDSTQPPHPQQQPEIMRQLEAVQEVYPNDSNGNVAPRPLSLLGSRGRQSAEEVESPGAGGNVEEKVLAQIRAKNNVANLIAKFNTAKVVADEAKENGGAKQKQGENVGGAVNIQAMRQKFSQK